MTWRAIHRRGVYEVGTRWRLSTIGQRRTRGGTSQVLQKPPQLLPIGRIEFYIRRTDLTQLLTCVRSVFVVRCVDSVVT